MVKKYGGLAAANGFGEPSAAVIDLDNFQLMGSGRNARLNPEQTAAALAACGVVHGIVLAEHFYYKDYHRWARLGFRAISTKGVNADPEVAAYVRRLGRKYKKIYVLTGDGDLALEILEGAADYRLEFWAQSWKMSNRIWANASLVRFIDTLVSMPRRNDWAALSGRSASYALH